MPKNPRSKSVRDELGIPNTKITVHSARITLGLVQATLRRRAGNPWKRLFAGISHRVLNLAVATSDLKLTSDYTTTHMSPA
jgi:hypothetical protein